MPKTIIAVLAIIMAAIFTACSTQQDPIENTVPIDAVSSSSTAEEIAIPTDTALPADWPTDVPLYPKSSISFSHAGGDSSENVVVLASTADLQEVKNYYTSELASGGWSITNTMHAGNNTIYLAEKESRTLSVTITGNDGAVDVTLGLQKK